MAAAKPKVKEAKELTSNEKFFEKFDNESEKNLQKNLNMVVGSLIGMPVMILVEVGMNRNDKRIELTSDNLASRMSPRMFEELRVRAFGGGTSDEGRAYWIPVKYTYEHFNGGSNGSGIADIYIKPDGSIREFRSNLERRLDR